VALPRAIWAGIYGKRRLREIDRRVRSLSARLESAEVVDPKQQKKLDQVFLGATVTYADGRGNEKTITIVGIDEADLSRGQVSWSLRGTGNDRCLAEP
jgi:transcription elongation factor GreB